MIRRRLTAILSHFVARHISHRSSWYGRGLPCVALPILALLLTSCQPGVKANAEDAKPPTPVHAVPVRLFTPQSGERYSASLIPARQLTLSFRVAGFVESIGGGNEQSRRLEAGDLIQQGTTLAVLRAKDYDLQILQAKGQLESAKRNIEVARAHLTEADAAFAKADAVWKRASSLFDSRAVTAPDWEAAKAQRDISFAQINGARSQIDVATAQESTAAAALSSAELAKADTVLIAPYTARLLQRSVEVGSLVSPGQTAFILADTETVKVVFGVPDSSVRGLKQSDRVPLSVEAVPGQFSGTVTSIAAAADPATRLFLIEASVPNPKGTLRPGMIATVYLRASGAVQPIAVVPLSAIVRSKAESGGFSLMVVRMNRARSQAVTLSTTYGDLIAVAGVQPGELVISSGASLLAEGERVDVIQ
jgi:RND family efflux transporter MFP subunit